ncbi:MAG TPA: YciI family protein [Candidatus Dormibacteraeota bacterium]|nr:YciI family protein [Candidatus Dormibacteraeota bacterium]
MKYLLLICGDENDWTLPETLPVEDWLEAAREMRLDGHRLRPTREAVTVRVRDGQLMVTDGPFAETKEQMGGYDVIECDSLDEAVALAARHPVAGVGSIEVRPFWPD